MFWGTVNKFLNKDSCLKDYWKTQHVSVTWPKFATGLRSRPKGWELDHYVFFSWWHIYLMFLISVLPNLEGKKYFFGDVTLTCTVPIWGVLPRYLLFFSYCFRMFEYGQDVWRFFLEFKFKPVCLSIKGEINWSDAFRSLHCFVSERSNLIRMWDKFS